MKFILETTKVSVERDGKTHAGFRTDVKADLNDASFEELTALLAYLGANGIEDAIAHFEKTGEINCFYNVAKEFSTARKEMIANIKGLIARKALGAMLGSLKKEEAEEKTADKPASRKPSAKAKKEGK